MMAENSKIEWTDHTANFWWGCLKVSPGCEHCYADTLAHRYGKAIWGPAKTTSRELKKSVWAELPKWNKAAQDSGQRRRVFVMSMGDFFEDHFQVTDWRIRAMRLIEECTWLDFQILTKRPENVPSMAGAWMELGFPPNVWLGTSVENQAAADERIPELLKIPARVRFLSMEPLLGPVDLGKHVLIGPHHITGQTVWWPWLEEINWVIVGGESGPQARPMHPDWARSIRNQCQAAGVPFFFKQWGEWGQGMKLNSEGVSIRCASHEFGFSNIVFRVGKKAAGRLLDGVEHNNFPQAVQA